MIFGVKFPFYKKLKRDNIVEYFELNGSNEAACRRALAFNLGQGRLPNKTFIVKPKKVNGCILCNKPNM